MVRKYKNYNFEPVKNARKILWPIAVAYDGVTQLRNFLFDKEVFNSKVYNFPVIGIGNLSTGGTGKSPMTEYVISLLNDSYRVATLSRGYGRKTTGYLDVSQNSTASEVGDEPLQFARKFKDVQVAVCENRVEGISKLREKSICPDVVVLDDVYQHRKVSPGLLILLTAYDDLFYQDLVLPAGNLREKRAGADRADCIVVTKCPNNLSEENQHKIRAKISRYSSAPVYFAAIAYSEIQSIRGSLDWEAFLNKKITVVTGIAKPKPFLKYLESKKIDFNHLKFSDHHNFTEDELNKLDNSEIIITTEKDFVRLDGKLKKSKLYYIPIAFKFLDDAENFNEMILNYIDSTSR